MMILLTAALLAEGWGDMVAGGVATAVFGGIATILTILASGWRGRRRDDAKAGLARDKSAAAAYHDLFERMETHISELQKALEESSRQNSSCDKQLAAYWAWITHAHTRIMWLSQQARASGRDPGPDLSLPTPPERHDDPEYAERSAAQKTQLLQETSAVIKPTTPPGSQP